MRWIFAGAGNMASSLIGGLTGAGTAASDISVVDPDASARERLARTARVSTHKSIEQALDSLQNEDEALVLVIAVKPDVVQSVCRDTAARLAHMNDSRGRQLSPLVISVAAGVRCSSMQAWLPENTAIVRCMPNTPALLGLGASVLYANEACSERQRQQAQALLDSAGLTLWIDDESRLDAVTALSGSGPAYFFYLIEQMSEAGKALGLEADHAEQLAIETAYGAASMARQRQFSPAVLREKVTSKGGTTAAALNIFNEREMPAIVLQAMQAAHDRAVELGDLLAPD